MNTLLKERLQAVRLLRQAEAVDKFTLTQASRGRLGLVPTRRRAKAGRKSFRVFTAEKQASSMLNMGKPAGHKTLPRFPSEKDKVLFAAHMRRKEAGWVRG